MADLPMTDASSWSTSNTRAFAQFADQAGGSYSDLDAWSLADLAGYQVRAVPRTLSGKRLEVPVKRILLGADPAAVASLDSLVKPEAFADAVALAASFPGQAI
jgi:hypothetical protein